MLDLSIIKKIVNFYDAIQHGIRDGLTSVVGDCHVKCKNKEIDPEYTGKEISKIFRLQLIICFCYGSSFT